jgi:iron complex outermembrane recepter protein
MNCKMLSGIPFSVCSLVGLALGCGGLFSDTRADSPGTPSELDEVIVTATKTGAQSVQEVPIAITAFTSQMLEATGSTQLSDLTHQTPGFTYAANGPWAVSTIRGVGTNNVFAGGDPSTTVQVDGVYYGRPTGANLDFLDVDRVEILRGPQGTIYGRNADAGTINVVTKDPTTDYSGDVKVSAGNYGLFRPEAVLSGPLIGDTVLFSLATFGSWHDAYVKELTPGLPDQWNQNRDGVRGKLLFQIQPNLRFVLNADYTDVNEYMNASYVRITAPPFPDGTDPSFYQTSLNHPYFLWQRQGGVSGKLVWDLGNVELTSITAYRRSYMNNGGDLDYTRNEVFTTRKFQENQDQESEELNLSGKADRLKYVVGTFLYREHASSYYNAVIFDDILETQGITVLTKSAAAFGQATYDVTDDLSAIAGVRYTHDTKDSSNIYGSVFGPPPVADVSAPTTQVYAASPSYSATTPKFGLNYQIDKDILTYASVTKGYKAGGSNLLTNLSALDKTLYGPESVWAYEVGYKQTLHGSVPGTVDLSLFRNDYKGLQVNQFIFTPTGVGQVVSNAPGAITTGAELEVNLHPTEAVRIGATAAYLSAKYHGRYLSLNDFTQVSFDADGRTLNDSPSWSGSAYGQYTFHLPNVALSFRADGEYKGNVYYSPLNDPREAQKSYTLVNLGARAELPAGWELGLVAKNVAGVRYITAAYYAFSSAGTPGEPMTIVGYFKYAF